MKVQKYQPTLCLKPTQFAVGIVEVEYKVAEMRKLKKSKLQKLIDDTPIPVVLSPWKELCVVDHHHFLFACWHAEIREVKIKLIEDFSKSKLSYVEFWKRMAEMKYAYLMDQFGEGPRDPLYLPSDVRGMADDPYRSLAWIVRKEGGYEKSEVTFSEFAWADFFRAKKLLILQGRNGLKEAAHEGVVLARSSGAKALPGFIDKKKVEMEGKIEKVSGKDSKFVPEASEKGALATVPKIAHEKNELPQIEKIQQKLKKVSKEAAKEKKAHKAPKKEAKLKVKLAAKQAAKEKKKSKTKK
jgi:hypothetical protein